MLLLGVGGGQSGQDSSVPANSITFSSAHSQPHTRTRRNHHNHLDLIPSPSSYPHPASTSTFTPHHTDTADSSGTDSLHYHGPNNNNLLTHSDHLDQQPRLAWVHLASPYPHQSRIQLSGQPPPSHPYYQGTPASTQAPRSHLHHSVAPVTNAASHLTFPLPPPRGVHYEDVDYQLHSLRPVSTNKTV